MIAADRRRLTPALAVLCALLALLLVLFWIGAGRGVHWDDDHAPPPLPPARSVVAAPVVPSLQAYAMVWERPLFSDDRKPIPGGGEDNAAASGDFELTGVILLPNLHMALLREKSSGRTLRVREGESANGNGPLVVEVKPRSVVIDAAGTRSELALKPGPAPAANAVDNAQPAGQASLNMTPVAEDSSSQPDAPPPADTSDAAAASARARIAALKARIQQRRAQSDKQRATQKQNDGEQ